MIEYGWDNLKEDVPILARQVEASEWKPQYVLGLSRGGIIPGFLLSGILDVPYKTVNPFCALPTDLVTSDCLLVDDIEDSGTSLEYFKLYPKLRTAVLHSARGSTDYSVSKKPKDWVTYPWETKTDEAGGIKQGVVTLLRGIGEDPLREGLIETPSRVEKALHQLTAGYHEDIDGHFKTFEAETVDQVVLLKDIPYYSLCEHHMLPFWGKISIAYIPDKRIIGLSKLARVANAYARRLQVQERLTQQIADKIQEKLNPKGVAVLVQGEHLCMRMRGIEREGMMKTSVLLGKFRTDGKAREEFYSLLR